jgi:hypothetical protein
LPSFHGVSPHADAAAFDDDDDDEVEDDDHDDTAESQTPPRKVQALAPLCQLWVCFAAALDLVDQYSLSVLTQDSKVEFYDFTYSDPLTDDLDWTEMEGDDAYILRSADYKQRAQLPALLWVEDCPVAVPFKETKTLPRRLPGEQPVSSMNKCIIHVEGSPSLAVSCDGKFSIVRESKDSARGYCLWFPLDSCIRIALLGRQGGLGDCFLYRCQYRVEFVSTCGVWCVGL